MDAVDNVLAASQPLQADKSVIVLSTKRLEPTETAAEADIGARSEVSRPIPAGDREQNLVAKTTAKPVAKMTARQVVIDAETQSVIFQTIDKSTDTVVSQYPGEAQLNLRAYLRTAVAATSQPGSLDRTA